MEHSIPLDPKNRAENPEYDSSRDDDTREVVPDVAYKRLMIVNVAFIGQPGEKHWVLVDAGMMGTAETIADAAEKRFGKSARPAAIVLTHGHFDHVGALEKLADRWDAPIIAHQLEVPYLDGSASYPPPDPSVGGGMMSAMSRFFPRGPVNVANRLQPFPANGSIPFMPGWKWIHTPGHTPGHVSLWRESDRILIAGDAFITTKQESAYAAVTEKPEMHGPPMYYTQNWHQAHVSVSRLAMLEPEIAVTGHGVAMRGAEMRTALHRLAREFNTIAVPEQGKYIERPTDAASGSAYTSPS